MDTPSLINMAKRPTAKMFRRFFVKRRQVSDGQFEATWQDLTDYVIKWGGFKWSIDTPRFGDVKFHNANLRVLNIDGTFNPNDNADSFWNGYGDLQRSLVKIEAGFIHQTQSAGGIWTNTEFPTNTTFWRGMISGDIGMTGRGELVLPLKPALQAFRDFPSNDLDGFTSTGMSAGGFFALLRDQTDGAGNYVFRPHIGDGTSTDWNIATGNALYANLNTSSAEDLIALDTWDVSTRLAEAEQYIPYVNNKGSFIWKSKDPTTTVAYEFHGLGSRESRTYGMTIKRILDYGKRLTSFYSRVAVKYEKDDTNTSFEVTALAFAVAGSNTAWNLGKRTFRVDNFWIATANAASVAGAVFDEVSSQKNQIHFTSTFVPELDLLDRISVTYDATDLVTGRSLWDLNDWASNPSDIVTSLIWDDSRGDGIILNSTNFKILSINHNLDNFESTFICKEI
jgi:hypothetical protein